MLIAILTFVSVFVLIGSAGLLLMPRRNAAKEQVNAAFTQAGLGNETGLKSKVQQAGAQIGGVVGRFEGAIPKSQSEVSILRQRLIRAGFRNDSAVNIFYGAKFVLMILLVATVLITKVAAYNYFFVIFAALAGGFLAPDFWLGNRIKGRQKKIRRALPDVLDLLVVCVEAGLSLDHATLRTANELELSAPELSDEMKIVALEGRAGCPRADAWKHLAERTDVEQIRHLVTMLVQSEKFGTSIAKTLRIHSETQRTKRVQQVEEMAAKMTIKILFPLVLFIFPSLFLVTLGPALILMFEQFQSGFGQ
jgi:tight adherence protein C